MNVVKSSVLEVRASIGLVWDVEVVHPRIARAAFQELMDDSVMDGVHVESYQLDQGKIFMNVHYENAQECLDRCDRDAKRFRETFAEYLLENLPTG